MEREGEAGRAGRRRKNMTYEQYPMEQSLNSINNFIFNFNTKNNFLVNGVYQPSLVAKRKQYRLNQQ